MTTKYQARVCPECGRTYEVPAGSMYARKYCADACTLAASSRNQTEFWQEWRAEKARREASR